MSEENDGHREAERRDEAEEMARLQEQINNLPVSEHILFMMHSLSSLAVDRLGLVPEASARLDVAQAHLAIEAFKALLGVLEEAMPTEEVAAHRGVLSQLQLAYVGALGGAAPAGGAAEAEREPAEQAPVREMPESDAAPEPFAKGDESEAPEESTAQAEKGKPGDASSS